MWKLKCVVNVMNMIGRTLNQDLGLLKLRLCYWMDKDGELLLNRECANVDVEVCAAICEHGGASFAYRCKAA